MTIVAPLVRLLPLAFLGRLGVAFVEITLAALVISTSVVVGHDLKQWRAWYWDPSTLRPWMPTPSPTPIASAAPVPVVIHVAVPVTAMPATPAPACGVSSGDEELVFARSGLSGAECVWLDHLDDGTHLRVAVNGFAVRDLGVVAPPSGGVSVRVYAPAAWQEPVVVVVAPESVLVFSWQGRGIIEFLRAGGDHIGLASDTGGWPRVNVMQPGGMRSYRWNGASFALYP